MRCQNILDFFKTNNVLSFFYLFAAVVPVGLEGDCAFLSFTPLLFSKNKTVILTLGNLKKYNCNDCACIAVLQHNAVTLPRYGAKQRRPTFYVPIYGRELQPLNFSCFLFLDKCQFFTSFFQPSAYSKQQTTPTVLLKNFYIVMKIHIIIASKLNIDYFFVRLKKMCACACI